MMADGIWNGTLGQETQHMVCFGFGASVNHCCFLVLFVQVTIE